MVNCDKYKLNIIKNAKVRDESGPKYCILSKKCKMFQLYVAIEVITVVTNRQAFVRIKNKKKNVRVKIK